MDETLWWRVVLGLGLVCILIFVIFVGVIVRVDEELSAKPARSGAAALVPGWLPPRELAGSTPRSLRRKALGRTIHYGRIGGGCFLLCAGAALAPWVLPELIRLTITTAEPKWDLLDCWLFTLYLPAFVSWFWMYLYRRRTEWLLKWGRPAAGVVTRVRSEYVHSEGGGAVVPFFDMVYRDQGGNLWECEREGEHCKGQVLTVLHDPGNPAKCIIYPCRGYEVRGSGGSISLQIDQRPTPLADRSRQI